MASWKKVLVSGSSALELSDISSVGSGSIITANERTKLNGIEALADVTDATNVAAAGAVMDSDFTANGFMKRTAAGTYTVDSSTYNNYSHPNHTGDVTSSGDGATTIVTNAVTHAKYQQVATDTIIGRTAAGTGNVTALTKAEVLSVLNVEDGADVTDATNVAAAGAVMDGDFTSNGFMVRTGSGSYTVDTSTYVTTAGLTTSLGNLTTDDIDEGSTNLYFPGFGTAAGEALEGTTTVDNVSVANLQTAISSNNNFTLGTAANTITVPGSLEVQGTVTTLDSSNVTIKDQFIFLADATSPADVDGGIVVQQANNDAAVFAWDTSVQRWGAAYAGGSSTLTELTPIGHVPLVHGADGNSSNATGALAQIGNIYINTNSSTGGDIYIYS
jgi:hypothetical protein